MPEARRPLRLLHLRLQQTPRLLQAPRLRLHRKRAQRLRRLRLQQPQPHLTGGFAAVQPHLRVASSSRRFKPYLHCRRAAGSSRHLRVASSSSSRMTQKYNVCLFRSLNYR